MGFFSGGGTTQTSDSYSGLRGLGGTAQDMASFLVPSIKSGAQAGQNMFINPSQYLDSNGLYSQQSSMFPTIVNQIMGKMSAGGAARGQLNAANTSAIAGSSATAAAPTLLPLIGENINNIRNAGGNMFTGMLSTGAASLGSETHSTARTTAPGIGYNWANSFGNNLFGEFGKSLGGRIGGGMSLPSGLGG